MSRRQLNIFTVWLVLLASTAVSTSTLADNMAQTAGSQDNGLQVQNPQRAFGYFVGDILEQKINLDSSDLLVPNLESAQRINEFLYRLDTTVKIEDKQRWFSIRYQIINTSHQTTAVSLPEVAFNTESNDEILLEPWTFNIAALTTDNIDGKLTPLPDTTGHALVSKLDNRGLQLSFVALISTLLLWIVWWVVRHFRDSHTLPFAKARRIITKLPTAERDNSSDAWVALHHAFNDVAGKTISAGSTDALYTAAPWLISEKELIEQFYKVSSGRFFKQSKTLEQIPVDTLSRALYRLEKRQAKNQAKHPLATVKAN